MNLQEAEAKMKMKMSFRKRMEYEFWGIYFAIEHHFRRITKICPHDSTTGYVGQKEYFCLDCGRMIPNTEWKEDRKALKNAE